MSKISNLPPGTAVNGEEQVVMVQGGQTRRLPMNKLFAPMPLESAISALEQATDNGIERLPDALDYVRAGMLVDFTAGYYRRQTATAATLAALGGVNVVQPQASLAIEPGGALLPIPANMPRESKRGLIVEGAATQMLRYASQVATIQSPESVGWQRFGHNITISGGHPDPAGGTGAARLSPTSANAFHRTHQVPPATVVPGSTFSFGAFFKPDGYRRVYLQVSSASQFHATADLISGTVTNAAGLYGDPTPATWLIPMADGWWYFAMSGTLANGNNNSSSVAVFVHLIDDAGNITFAGDTAKGMFMFRPMLNPGLIPQAFLDSAASATNRPADQVTLALPAGSPADQIVISHGDGAPVVTTITRAQLASANELRLHSDAATPWLNRPITRIELRPAAALGASASGRLKSAVRTLGFQPRRAGALPANDQPTLTLGVNGAASAIDGASQSNPRIARSDPRLNYVSGVPMLFGTTFPRYNFLTSRGAFYGYSDAGGTVPARGTAYFAYEFIHTGTQFEIPTLGNGNSGVNFRILVNGCVAGTLSNPNGDGGGRLNLVQFPTPGTRLIRVETGGVPCNGVHVESSAEISASNRSYPLVTLIGDSFVEGSGSDVGDLSAIVTARSLGLNPALAGVGATGIINPGNNNTSGFPKVPWTHAERLRDLTLEGVTDPRTGQGVTANVAAGIVFASLNDQGLAAGVWNPFGATLIEAIANRFDVLIDDWVRVHGAKPLFLFGPTWPSGLPGNPPSLDIFRIRDGVQQAAEGRAGSNVWFIDRLMPARRQGVRSNSGDQASLYTGTDGTHPTADGHRFDGLTDAEALRQQILLLA